MQIKINIKKYREKNKKRGREEDIYIPPSSREIQAFVVS